MLNVMNSYYTVFRTDVNGPNQRSPLCPSVSALSVLVVSWYPDGSKRAVNSCLTLSSATSSWVSPSLSRASRDLSILAMRLHRDRSRLTILSRSPANTTTPAQLLLPCSCTHRPKEKKRPAALTVVSYRWTCCTCPSHWLSAAPVLVCGCWSPAPGAVSAPHTALLSPAAGTARCSSEPHTAPPETHTAASQSLSRLIAP